MPFVIDLYCGLGGWTEGFLAEGFTVYGFDIERTSTATRSIRRNSSFRTC